MRRLVTGQLVTPRLVLALSMRFLVVALAILTETSFPSTGHSTLCKIDRKIHLSTCTHPCACTKREPTEFGQSARAHGCTQLFMAVAPAKWRRQSGCQSCSQRFTHTLNGYRLGGERGCQLQLRGGGAKGHVTHAHDLAKECGAILECGARLAQGTSVILAQGGGTGAGKEGKRMRNWVSLRKGTVAVCGRNERGRKGGREA